VRRDWARETVFREALVTERQTATHNGEAQAMDTEVLDIESTTGTGVRGAATAPLLR
jgi:hypothetical protein